MLNQEKPREYVLASGQMHTIRHFLEACLGFARIDFFKRGLGDSEKYFDKVSGACIVEIDPKFYRPAEVHELCGAPSLAEEKLGWERKVDFRGFFD